MAKNFMSSILDELMGRDRDALPDEAPRKMNWDDPEMCPFYLVCFCPHELFVNTKADLGSCSKFHDEQLKKKYAEEAPGYKKSINESEFIRFAEKMISDIEGKIKRGKMRIALANGPDGGTYAGPGSKNAEKIALLTERINALLDEAESAGCEGNVEKAQGLMKLCDQLKDEKEQLKSNEVSHPWNPDKAMQVCEVCGSYLIIGEAQHRLDDHIMGKQHVGFAMLRKNLEDVKKAKEKRDQEERDKIEKERERRWASRNTERDVAASSSKDRRRDSESDKRSRVDRGGDRDRTRERDRDRSGRSGRDKEKEKESDKDRDRRKRSSLSLDKGKEGDRDKERERSKGKDGEKDRISLERDKGKDKESEKNRSSIEGDRHKSKDTEKEGGNDKDVKEGDRDKYRRDRDRDRDVDRNKPRDHKRRSSSRDRTRDSKHRRLSDDSKRSREKKSRSRSKTRRRSRSRSRDKKSRDDRHSSHKRSRSERDHNRKDSNSERSNNHDGSGEKVREIEDEPSSSKLAKFDSPEESGKRQESPGNSTESYNKVDTPENKDSKGSPIRSKDARSEDDNGLYSELDGIPDRSLRLFLENVLGK